MWVAYALTAVDNEPSTRAFCFEMGVSIRETKEKLRTGIRCGFGSRVRDRAAYARMRLRMCPGRSGRKNAAPRPGHGCLTTVIARSSCDEAIQSVRVRDSGLLRFARNDERAAFRPPFRYSLFAL